MTLNCNISSSLLNHSLQPSASVSLFVKLRTSPRSKTHTNHWTVLEKKKNRNSPSSAAINELSTFFLCCDEKRPEEEKKNRELQFHPDARTVTGSIELSIRESKSTWCGCTSSGYLEFSQFIKVCGLPINGGISRIYVTVNLNSIKVNAHKILWK